MRLPAASSHLLKHLTLTVIALALLIVIAVGAMAVGRAMLSPGTVIEVLWQLATGDGDTPLVSRNIVLNVRLPRVAAAAMIGGALAISGAAYQGLFRNPMVSPDILGASTGASFGAALALLLSLGSLPVRAAAFAGGLAAVFITYTAARSIGRGSSQVLLLVLCGMIVSALFQAFVSTIKYTADPDSKLPEITYWLMGSIAKVTWSDLRLFAIPFILGVVPLLAMRWRLNILAFGDEEAESLGINAAALRLVSIVCATLLTASCVAVSGVIGWVGLIMPHVVRFIAGPDNRIVVPLSVILGGAFLIAVDTACRTVISSEIPLGILTSIIGAPLFFLVLLRTQQGGRQ
ncbi:FecCD family ABC transporter permease [Actinomyces sp. oral taxon 171]|uniref:FecCD family ABC transporter permease n=1 Tax=Actinomyces sp. oral taxon 171 TaxID=706438 RepID=UPI0001F61A63|nr:iron ABC transporter permease [Actinomyces sp. oral taxon 171]EFW27357.1 iron chelate uptake ABC transporter, FeCT family, permease protein [Actinomyces sp. oral taxon 171 str. F0337]QCT33815.1 iron ABC transporter permease [Actinomyces sp. oral taxon 171 str. F0337]